MTLAKLFVGFVTLTTLVDSSAATIIKSSARPGTSQLNNSALLDGHLNCGECFIVWNTRVGSLKKLAIEVILRASRLVESMPSKFAQQHDNDKSGDQVNLANLENKLDLLSTIILTNKLSSDRLDLLYADIVAVREDLDRIHSARSSHSIFQVAERRKSSVDRLEHWSGIQQKLTSAISERSKSFDAYLKLRSILNSGCYIMSQLERSLDTMSDRMMDNVYINTPQDTTRNHQSVFLGSCAKLVNTVNGPILDKLVEPNFKTCLTITKAYQELLSFASHLHGSTEQAIKLQGEFEKNKLRFNEQERLIDALRLELSFIVVSKTNSSNDLINSLFRRNIFVSLFLRTHKQVLQSLE